MGRPPKKFQDEQITSARKALQSLAVKDTGKTRDEAFEALEKDIKEALKKGYSLDEVSEILGQNGVSLPVSFLKKFDLVSKRKRKKKEIISDESCENEILPNESLQEDIKSEFPVDDISSVPRQDAIIEKNFQPSYVSKHNGFVVPDLPDDEL